MSMGKEFREFILRGSVVDLAVGVIIGAAFGSVVTAFTKDIITPLIGIPGKLSVGDISFQVNGSKFLIGDFINAVISFLIMAFVVFFFVVRPVNWLMSRKKTEPQPEAEPDTRECPYCLSKIPARAAKCAFCTADVPAVAAP